MEHGMQYDRSDQVHISRMRQRPMPQLASPAQQEDHSAPHLSPLHLSAARVLCLCEESLQRVVAV